MGAEASGGGGEDTLWCPAEVTAVVVVPAPRRSSWAVDRLAFPLSTTSPSPRRAPLHDELFLSPGLHPSPLSPLDLFFWSVSFI